MAGFWKKDTAVEDAREVDELPLDEPDGDPDIHVAPVNDFKEHVCERFSGTTCWCNPRRDDECENVVVHNSMDERETYENGRAKH